MTTKEALGILDKFTGMILMVRFDDGKEGPLMRVHHSQIVTALKTLEAALEKSDEKHDNNGRGEQAEYAKRLRSRGALNDPTVTETGPDPAVR